MKFSMQLANALFHSKLLYGIEVWGLCPKYLIHKVQILQHKAARITQSIKSRSLDSKTLLKNMKWLSIQDLIDYRISCLVHQVVYTHKPEYLYKMLILNNNIKSSGQSINQQEFFTMQPVFCQNFVLFTLRMKVFFRIF